MRPLRYSINVTVDGSCDHTAVHADEHTHRFAADAFERADAIILGRVTYTMMEEAWRSPAETGTKASWMEDWMMPFALAIHGAKKYVVSSTLDHVDWNAEIVRGADLEPTVRALKEVPGKGLYVGGVTLPLALARCGLIDEYEFLVHPVIAGRGPMLLAGLAEPLALTLVGRREYGAATAMRYAPVTSPG